MNLMYVALLMVLVPRYGPVGAAAATCLATAVQLFVRYVTVRRLVGIRSLAADVVRPISAAAVTLVVAIVLHGHVSLPALLLAVVASYVCAALAFDRAGWWAASGRDLILFWHPAE